MNQNYLKFQEKNLPSPHLPSIHAFKQEKEPITPNIFFSIQYLHKLHLKDRGVRLSPASCLRGENYWLI